jgi:hypothetical protein
LLSLSTAATAQHGETQKLKSNLMQNPPQNVSERYVTNLLYHGRNNTFDISDISRRVSVVDDICVGVYYQAVVNCPAALFEEHANNKFTGVGATPAQAVRHALSKFGVTFA